MEEKEKIAKIIQQFSVLAEKHHAAVLQSAENNFRLRQIELERLRDLAKFTHEIKKPLSMIRYLIEDSDLPVTQKINAEISRAARLADGMLLLARLQLKNNDFTKREDLSRLVHLAVNDFARRYSSHVWSSKVQSQISSEILREDFLSILENLLDNAARHTTAQTKISVNFFLKKNQIFLIVSDDGGGISRENQPKILQSFFRGVKSSGSGLGLAIVAEAVEKIGGQLDFTSRRGHTEFRVRFSKIN